MKEIFKVLERVFYTEAERKLQMYIYFESDRIIDSDSKSKDYVRYINNNINYRIFERALGNVERLVSLEKDDINRETISEIVEGIVKYSKDIDDGLLRTRFADLVITYKYYRRFDTFTQFLFFVFIDLYFMSKHDEVMDNLKGMFIKAILSEYKISLEEAKELSRFFFKGEVSIAELQKWFMYFTVNDTIKYLSKGYSLSEALDEEDNDSDEEDEE